MSLGWSFNQDASGNDLSCTSLSEWHIGVREMINLGLQSYLLGV
jgi:hypothetical protein